MWRVAVVWCARTLGSLAKMSLTMKVPDGSLVTTNCGAKHTCQPASTHCDRPHHFDPQLWPTWISSGTQAPAAISGDGHWMQATRRLPRPRALLAAAASCCCCASTSWRPLSGTPSASAIACLPRDGRGRNAGGKQHAARAACSKPPAQQGNKFTNHLHGFIVLRSREPNPLCSQALRPRQQRPLRLACMSRHTPAKSSAAQCTTRGA